MVDISDTRHSNERHVVQEPSNDRVDTGIMDVIDIGLLELVIASLPANEVPGDHQGEYAERGCGAPVYEGVAQEEILDDCIVPTTHSEADIEYRPLPELGCEIVLLVGVWNKSVVGCHHGYIQMDEVL